MATTDEDTSLAESDAPSSLPTPLIVLFFVIAASLPPLRFAEGALGNILPLAFAAVFGSLLALGYSRKLRLQPFLDVAVVLCILGAFASTRAELGSVLSFGITLIVVLSIAPRVVAAASTDPRWVRAVGAGFLLSQSVSAMVALVQFAGGSVGGLSANEGRANGLAGHPNILGLMSGIALILCFAALANRVGKPVVIVGALMLNGAALISSGSLSALSSTLVALIVACVATRTVVPFVVTLAIVGVLAALVLTVSGGELFGTETISNRVDVVTGESQGVASLQIRQLTYDYALRSIEENPVYGVGVGASRQGTYDGVTVVHDHLLRAYYQGGLPTFLGFTLVTVTALVTSLAALLRRDCRTGAAAGVVVLVFSYAATSAFWDQFNYWLPIVVGLCVLSTQGDRSSRLLHEEPPVSEVSARRPNHESFRHYTP